MSAPSQRFITIAALSRRISLHRDTLYAWIKSGRLRAIRTAATGGKYLVAEEDVDALLASMAATPPKGGAA